jgi:hypothetical protein
MNFNILILLLLLLAAACREMPVGGATADNRMKENNQRKSNVNAPDNRSANQSVVELSKIPTVTYCDLIRQPVLYDRKVVRVRAVYYTAFEKMYLYDERCEPDQPPAAPEKVPAEIWAETDKSFVHAGNSDEAKLNRELDGFGRKDATLIGIFSSTPENPEAPNRFGHLNCCQYLFQILRVEKVTSRQDD